MFFYFRRIFLSAKRRRYFELEISVCVTDCFFSFSEPSSALEAEESQSDPCGRILVVDLVSKVLRKESHARQSEFRNSL